jgi:hypothetical protein
MKEIYYYIELIDNQLFYEAHEVLEALWFPIRRDKKPFTLVLKGFINAAVSMELYKKGKIPQSKKIYKVYLKYTNESRINEVQDNKIFHDLRVFMDKKFEIMYKHSFNEVSPHP